MLSLFTPSFLFGRKRGVVIPFVLIFRPLGQKLSFKHKTDVGYYLKPRITNNIVQSFLIDYPVEL